MEFDAPDWQVAKAAVYRVKAPILGPMHRHVDQYQVFSVLDGEGTVIIGGQEFDAAMGGVFWIPPGIAHASNDPPGGCPEMIELRFRPDPSRRGGWGSPEFPYHIPAAHYPSVETLLRGIVEEYWERNDYWRWAVSSLIDQLLIELIRVLSTTVALRDCQAYGYQVDPEAINRAVRYIHQHYVEPIELKTLARVAAMSVSRFGKTFKALKGKRPIEYLVEFRLQRAIEMLKEGRWTISQISEAVGFNSVHYFSRCFRNCFGVAPSARARMQAYDSAAWGGGSPPPASSSLENRGTGQRGERKDKAEKS